MIQPGTTAKTVMHSAPPGPIAPDRAGNRGPGPDKAKPKGTAIADLDATDTDSQVKQEIAIRISVLARLLRSDFDRRLSDINITRSQWGLIAVVARRPGSTQRSIAEILEMSEASAGRLIDRLCADGLLERREREDDRRARAVYVTPAAEPLLNRAAEVARANADRIFLGLDEQQIAQLSTSLGVMYHNLAKNAPWIRRIDPAVISDPT
ncbi:MAG: MarR family winged helix-turn-helix transcriptional regulator [Novosphingobium sp.]